jgi:hypothetical protein
VNSEFSQYFNQTTDIFDLRYFADADCGLAIHEKASRGSFS